MTDIGVNKDKLIIIITYPNEQEFLEMIEDELREKSSEEASKTFTTVLNKYQKEKDKFLTLSNNLQNLADSLFEGSLSVIDDTKIKLLKDLKLCVLLKTKKDNDPIPNIINKLHEGIDILHERPFVNLRIYLVCRDYERDDVLNDLCFPYQYYFYVYFEFGIILLFPVMRTI